MRKLALVFGIGASTLVAGCVVAPYDAVYGYEDPYYSQTAGAHGYGTYRQDTVTPAIDMCEVETLAQQRLDMLSELHGYRAAIRATPAYHSNVADTETQELFAAFETDLDASYRFATSSCRTYNRCLEENRFHEGACQDSAAMWREGQDRFHGLSDRLSLVRERISEQCDNCGYAQPAHYGYRPRQREYGYRHDYGDRYGNRRHYEGRRRQHGHYRRDDDLLGSVFSTSDGYASSFHDGHH